MDEKKLYYLGTGTQFVKTQCKEYKTIEGALKAAAKDESLVVWDEDGKVVGSLTDDVPEEALKTNPDGSVNAYDTKGNTVGTVDAKTVETVTGNTPEDDTTDAETDRGQQIAGDDAQQGKDKVKEEQGATGQPAQKNDENGANTASGNEKPEDAAVRQQENDGEDIPESRITNEEYGKFTVTVTCEGSLRLRRSASWDNSNECGRAAKGQRYIGKRIFMLDGLPMVETLDGLFLSAANEHVKIER